MESCIPGRTWKITDHRLFQNFGIQKSPSGYKQINVPIVFYIKDDRRKRVRCVAGGPLTEPTNNTIGCRTATLKSIRTCVFLAQLKGSTICSADVEIAYFETNIIEKIQISDSWLSMPFLLSMTLYMAQDAQAKDVVETLADLLFSSRTKLSLTLPFGIWSVWLTIRLFQYGLMTS